MGIPQLVVLVILMGFSVRFLHGLATWNKKTPKNRFVPQKQGSGNSGVLASLKLSFRLLSHNWCFLSLDLKSHKEAVESRLFKFNFIHKQ